MNSKQAIGLVLVSVMLTACTTTGQNNDKYNKQEDLTVYMPDGLSFSVQCRQSGFLGILTGDVEACEPALLPVWSEDPDDVFKRQSAQGI